MKIKLQITNRCTGSVIFKLETENNTMRKTIEAYVKKELSEGKSRADLTGADLTGAKNDMFLVLLHAISEIPFLKKSIIEGKIDGSTYDGACACLSGTLVNSCNLKKNNTKSAVLQSIMSVRNASRPIEKFFTAIKPGDMPENNAASKMALQWVNEFELLLTRATV
jgi:hypothetical protein